MKYTVKKSAILIAAAAMMLSSCSKREMDIVDPATYDDNEVAFTIGSVSATKAESAVKSELLEIASVKVSEDHTMYLVDNVTSLDQVPSEPATKGTPAFTENVKALYGSFNAVALDADDGTAAFSGSDSPHEFSWKQDMIWRHNYKEAIWSDKLPIYFFMWMPTDITSNGVEFNDNSYDVNDGSINFSYISPGAVTEVAEGETPESQSATKQQDILFASHKRTEKVNGESISFYHALTGVKFANYFNNDTSIDNNKTETLIRSVTISGLINSGTCVITPSKGNSAEAAEWTPGETTATFTQGGFSETFAEYSSTYSLDSKLNSTAASHNLNDADGTLTFWFIPQTLNSDVKIKVLFDIRVNGVVTFADQELEVSLGDALDTHKTWSAGELHTFTLRPEKVGVKIEDKMTDANTKKNVRFTNTGNVDQYVRVYMIGNWLGDRQIADNVYNGYDSILMGYTSADLTNKVEVARWNDKDFTYSGETKKYENWVSPGNPEGYEYIPYGDFVGLPEMGSSTDSGTELRHWKRHDKFYYYTILIGPGEDLPSTDPLFDSYTINTVPDFWIAGIDGVRRKARDVHFEMDLSVQAIAVPYDHDGNAIPYDKAWAAALGLSSVKELNDL